MPTQLYATQTYRLDKTGAWGSTVAVVDSAVADDTGGEAIDSASFNPASPPGAYKNIYAAVNAIAAYNNTNHSRNNAGGGVVYLKEGTHVWTGGTVSAGGQANAGTWITVTKFPGATRENVIIGSASGTKQAGEHLKLNQIKITNSTTVGFTGMDAVWMDNCVLASTGAATFYENKVHYFTASSIGNVDEYAPYSTTNSSRGMIRGNTSFEAINRNILGYFVTGNRMSLVTNGRFLLSDVSGQTAPGHNNAIHAFNFISSSGTNSLLAFDIGEDLIAKTHGTAIVQNVFERSSGTASVVQISADGSTLDNTNNVLVWHNIIAGDRINVAYNDINLNEVGPLYRRSWSFIGNVYDDYNIVTDIDTHGGTADADRYGNHGVIHGTGSLANVNLNRAGAAGYTNKFYGLYSTNLDNANPYYVSDNSVEGAGGGGGDYHLSSADSPLVPIIPTNYAVLPYDLEGYPRLNDGTGAAGAYEFDAVPSAFAFTDVTEATTSTEYTSDNVSVASINTAVAISITGGTYSVNGAEFTGDAGTVSSGDLVSVRGTSSGDYETTVDVILTIGGVSDTYSILTGSAPAATGGTRFPSFITFPSFPTFGR